MSSSQESMFLIWNSNLLVYTDRHSLFVFTVQPDHLRECMVLFDKLNDFPGKYELIHSPIGKVELRLHPSVPLAEAIISTFGWMQLSLPNARTIVLVPGKFSHLSVVDPMECSLFMNNTIMVHLKNQYKQPIEISFHGWKGWLYLPVFSFWVFLTYPFLMTYRYIKKNNN